MNRTAHAALALALGLVLSGCSTDEPEDPGENQPPTSASAAASPPVDEPTATTPEDPAPEEPAAAADGVFVPRAEYDADPASYHAAGDVVLFFSATWCPTCRVSVDSLTTEGVPAGLSVVQVDYDTATDLRRQYGVTVQHTYVQIDESGQELAKWTGSVSGDDIADQTV